MKNKGMNNANNNQRTWKKDLRLYVHVPFCVKKCDYCDFLSGPSDEEGIESYFEALYKEVGSYEGRTGDYKVSTVFIGGGTPSCVRSEYIARLLEELKRVFEFSSGDGSLEPEITIEANPGTVDKDKLADYRKAGINRLSFGLQSTHDRELRLLGRIHTYREFVENYRLARELGFGNINIDLMSALPGQELSSWEETLGRVTELGPEHISAYSLIIEEGTPFYERYGPEGKQKDELISEDLDRLIYKRTREILEKYGYIRYEISNYARPGYECRHNMAYWEGALYLGFGLGAASFIENTRFRNTDSLEEYIKAMNYNDRSHKNIMSTNKPEHKNEGLLHDAYGIRRDIIQLSKKDLIEEFMFLGLRMTRGVDRFEFKKRFGVSMDEIYGNILNRLEKENLVITCGGKVRLTDYGIDVSNRILSEFLLDKC